ncbi:MAG: hypothetical protein R3234_09250 [Thermoanaerobaculia bacterium]|nr:hypothetical protein [Thermoanaerobaculia bacterium]
MSETRSRIYEGSREEVLGAAREAVELWGGEWTETETENVAAEVRFPVQAGLRHSVARARIRSEREPAGIRLVLELDPLSWHLHGPAVAVLLPAALAALAVVLWPFFPALGALVPLGLVTALGAWFLVLTRLQNRGASELLETVEGILRTSS